MKITHLKMQGNNKTLISQRLIPNFDFCRQQLGFEDEKPLTSFSEDQIHWSQELMHPRLISWSQTSPQSRSNLLVARTYVSKINIVVADITSVKIRFIGHKNLRIQDQYCGRKHYFSQDQIHWLHEPTHPRSILWSQTSPQSRSDLLVAGTYISKIKIVVINTTPVKIRFIDRKNLLIQDQDHGCRY